jgi:hypothetical protein
MVDAELFISKLESYVWFKSEIFPGSRLTGKITANQFDFEINPPLGWMDGLKSKASGNISGSNGLTKLKEKYLQSPALRIILVY